MRRTSTRILAAACAAGAILIAAPGSLPAAAKPAPARRPASCKPMPPVDLELRLLSHEPGQPVRFETRVDAHRPVDDLQLEMRLPAGARWAGGARTLSGRLEEGGRKAVPMSVAIPARGHAEIQALVRFRLANGSLLTRGAHLSFDDGEPSKPPVGRASSWDGSPVVEFPAVGVSR